MACAALHVCTKMGVAKRAASVFVGLNFRGLEKNHEIHENIHPRKFCAIRYTLILQASRLYYMYAHSVGGDSIH